MTFLCSTAILLGCAAVVFFIGLLAVHFLQPRGLRVSLWHTFCQAVLLGDRYGAKQRSPAHSPLSPNQPSQFQGLMPPL